MFGSHFTTFILFRLIVGMLKKMIDQVSRRIKESATSVMIDGICLV